MKIQIRALLGATLSLVLATPAMASDWLTISKNKTGTVTEIDYESLQGDVHGMRTAWIKYDHSADATVRERKSMIKFSAWCDRRTLRMDRIITYDAKGEVINSMDGSSRMPREVIPDSVGEWTLGVLCYDPSQVGKDEN